MSSNSPVFEVLAKKRALESPKRLPSAFYRSDGPIAVILLGGEEVQVSAFFCRSHVFTDNLFRSAVAQWKVCICNDYVK